MNPELQQIADSLKSIETLLEHKALQENESDENILMQSVAQSLAKLSGAETIKGEKGDKGDTGERGTDGYTPVKGKDYYTKAEIKELIEKVRSMVKDGVDGKNGKDGKDGKSIAGKDGKDGRDGRDGADGKNGKDGTEITGEQIVEKHIALPREKRIAYEDLKGVPDVERFVQNAFMSRPSNNIYVEDEGIRINNGNPVEILNFTGSGVSVTYLNGRAIISIIGGGAGSSTPAQQDGVIVGLTNIVTLTNTPIANTLMLYINGEFISPSRYSLVGLVVTMGSALDASYSGLRYTVIYQY